MASRVRFKPMRSSSPAVHVGGSLISGSMYNEMEFSGFAGLNNKYSNIEIEDNEASDLLNVEFDDVGAIVKRQGYTSVLTEASNITGVVPYYTSTGTRTLAVAYGTNLTSFDPVAKTSTSITTTLAANGAKYTGTTYYNKLYLVNGNATDGLMTWDGTTFTKAISGAPKGQYIILYKNRIYVAGDTSNPNRLYMSDLGNGTSWPVSNFLDIGTGDGTSQGTITGLGILNDSLVVFKSNSIYLVKGSDPSNYTVVDMENGVGCVSHWTIQNIPGALLFLSRDGVYMFNGSKVELVSDKIEGSVKKWNQAYLTNAVAYVDKGSKKYYLSVPEGIGQTTNNYTYVFSYLYGWWTKHNIAMQACTSFAGTSMEPTPFFSDTASNLMQNQTGDNDNGNAIDAYLVTKHYDFGSSAHYKAFKQIEFEALAVAQPYQIAITFTMDFGKSSKSIQMPLTYAQSTVWNEFTWGKAKWGGTGGETAHLSTNVPGQARYLQFRIEGSGKDTPFTLLKWVVRYKMKRRIV